MLLLHCFHQSRISWLPLPKFNQLPGVILLRHRHCEQALRTANRTKEQRFTQAQKDTTTATWIHYIYEPNCTEMSITEVGRTHIPGSSNYYIIHTFTEKTVISTNGNSHNYFLHFNFYNHNSSTTYFVKATYRHLLERSTRSLESHRVPSCHLLKDMLEIMLDFDAIAASHSVS